VASNHRLLDGAQENDTSFECEFIIDATRYRYGFAANRTRISAEWLLQKRAKVKEAVLFEREGQRITPNAERFSELPEEEAQQKRRPLGVRITTEHARYDQDGKMTGTERFDLTTDESEGTRKFIALSGPLFFSITKGAILVIDEFEARLHPVLTQQIFNWFHTVSVKSNAQLLVATHDPLLMDPDFVRRDQIWFCEKDSKRVFEKLTSVLKERRSGPKGPYDEHSILRHRPDRRGVGFCCAGSAGGATGRATAHHEPSCRPQRHLLPPADWLPVASAAKRISTVWHGLPLLSSLAKLRCVGPSTSRAIRAGPSIMPDGQLVHIWRRPGGCRR